MSAAAWTAVKAKADEIGWPANWNTDLDVDRVALTTTIYGPPPEKFIFILRENGTHICRKISDAQSVLKVWSFADIYIFFWDGTELIGCDSVLSATALWVQSNQ